MPHIETQGISQDYSQATGDFDSIDRGNVSKPELIEILKKVSRLEVPDNDACPPSINTQLVPDYFTCFYASEGSIYCTDSVEGKMSIFDAASIICGEQTLDEYDALHGHIKTKADRSFGVAFVAAIIAAIAGVVIYKFIT
ncbi:MAG: hypothetical protein HKO58_11550 [Gammaproteobacteria bacterium]|nr:hypothetical protein [Gammaproteobacteria bacterium]